MEKLIEVLPFPQSAGIIAPLCLNKDPLITSNSEQSEILNMNEENHSTVLVVRQQ